MSSDRNDDCDYLSQSSADFYEVTNKRVRRKSTYDIWEDEPQSTFQRVLSRAQSQIRDEEREENAENQVCLWIPRAI